MRLIDSGGLKLSEGLTSEMVEAGIKRVLGEMPEIQQAGQHFYMNVKMVQLMLKKRKALKR